MRNLVFLLILANVAYFGWQRWVATPDYGDVTVFTESDLAPLVDLAPGPGAGEAGAGEDAAAVAGADTADADAASSSAGDGSTPADGPGASSVPGSGAGDGGAAGSGEGQESAATASTGAGAGRAEGDVPTARDNRSGDTAAESASPDAAAGGRTPRDPGAREPAERIELAADLGRPCVSIGPFADRTLGTNALRRVLNGGHDAGLRSATGQMIENHWVLVPGIPTREQAEAMVASLNQAGIDDVFLSVADDGGFNISLGLFSELARAERMRNQARELEVPATILPRTREGTVFWVDARLRPGHGALPLSETFGEGRVLLNDAATCPQED